MKRCAIRSALFDVNRRSLARQTGLERHKTYAFWYRKKYNLTSTDPRFLDATIDEIMADYFAHTFFDDPKAADEVVDDDFDPARVAEILGIDMPGQDDPLPDDWENL